MFQNLGVIFTSTAHSQLHKYLSHACNNDPLVHHDHIIIICILIDIFIITYLLTPWFRVLPEQLTGLQLVKKFPAFHGTRRFITALTSVRHLSLSWASPIQSTCPHPTSWRSILILSTHLRLGLRSDRDQLTQHFYNTYFITSVL